MNPYKVLGISPDVTDDEVKKAYRALSRRYHPDANINNPNKEAAEEKFREVQEAYTTVMKERQEGEAFGYTGARQASDRTSTSQDGAERRRHYDSEYREADYSHTYQSDIPPEIRAAMNFLRSGYYKEAMTSLLNIENEGRDAEWYYLASVASEGMGNEFSAMNFIDEALKKDPENFKYRQYKLHLEGVYGGAETYYDDYGDSWYEAKGSTYSRPYSGQQSVGGWCVSMLLLNLFCNICVC